MTERVDEHEAGRKIQAEIARHLVEHGRLENAGGGQFRQPLPIGLQHALRLVAAAGGKPARQHYGVDGAGAGGTDAVKANSLVLEQPIKHTPGEGAVAADALQRQVHRLARRDLLVDFGLILQARVKKQRRYGDSAVPLFTPSAGSRNIAGRVQTKARNLHF